VATSPASPAPVDAKAEEPGQRGRRPVRTALIAAVAVGAVMALLIVVLGTRKPAVDRSVSSPLLGRNAPAVAGRTIDGKTFDIGRQNTWVVVNFFASWCTPCRLEHPELRAFQREHAAKGDASLVSVVYSDQLSDVRRFFREEGGDWPVVLDEQGRTAVDYGVSGVPETYLISPTGIVVSKFASGVTRAGLDRVIADAEKADR